MRSSRTFAILLSFILGLLIAGADIHRAYAQETGAQAHEEENIQTIDAKAEELLKEIAEFYNGLQKYQVDMTVRIDIEMQSWKQQMTTMYDLALKRPNLLSMRTDNQMFGSIVVSDGETVFEYMPILQRYSTREAPQELDSVFPDFNLFPAGIGSGALVEAILLLKPLDEYLQHVESVKYSEETPDYHSLVAVESGFEWNLRVKKGNEPLLMSLSATMSDAFSEQMENLGGEGEEMEAMMRDMMHDIKMSLSFEFSDWQMNPELSDDLFTFIPPENATKTDSLLSDFEEGPHPLVGEQAPDFTLNRLNGDAVRLSEESKDSVVILDFWATWCGPCIEAIPVLIDVAEEFNHRGVKLFGVNQEEAAEVIEKFMKRRKLDFEVLLDPEGAVGDLYEVDGIPQTVIIGKDGVIQVVHTGFSSDLKQRLRSELEDILAGKNLAEVAMEEKPSLEPEGMVQLWQTEGSYSGVTTGSRRDRVLAAGHKNQMSFLDSSGQVVEEFEAPVEGSILRSGNLAGDDTREFLAFAPWGKTLTAFDSAGTVLWRISQGQGIDDVWMADLTGDNLDEVIVGYNGSTGLHVFDNRGRPLWQYAKIGNVWNVCAADVIGDGDLEVVSTSAGGDVYVFDTFGELLKKWATEGYSHMVRPAAGNGGGKTVLVVDDDGTLLGLDRGGEVTWRAKIGGAGAHIDSAMPAPDRPWLALFLRNSDLVVLNTVSGEIVASMTAPSPFGGISWLARENKSPLLVLATGRDLFAFEVTAQTSAP